MTAAALATRRRINVELPADLAAREPVEALHGASRSDVRLMVSDSDTAPSHHRFSDLPGLLTNNDLLVVNTSAAIAAAIDGRDGGDSVRVHVSTALPADLWLIEVRTPTPNGSSVPDPTDREGHQLTLRGGAIVHLLARFQSSNRLWVATIDLTGSAHRSIIEHLNHFGVPIRYSYVEHDWPLDAYQTVFGRIPGSAEMPSASRPFTPEIVTDLVTRGVGLTPLVLHTGVSSLESHEEPYPERFTVPASTARRINDTRAAGGRVIAVGTTVVRALESAVDDQATVHPAEGWADVIVRPGPRGGDGALSVDGLLTGWHEAEASHLLMLDAIAAPGALDAAYTEAVASRYRWHEFGDVHLIMRKAGRP